MRLSALPNAISIARIFASIVLAVLAVGQLETAFKVLFVLALLSDLADGLLARRLNCVSALGALLDSIADLWLVVAALVGIWMFHPAVFREDGTIVWIGVAFWCVAITVGLIRYGKLSSFHTRTTQLGMLVFHTFVLVLLFFGYFPWLLYTACGLVILAALEQLAMIRLLPEWTPDVTGGLVEVLRSRRGNTD